MMTCRCPWCSYEWDDDRGKTAEQMSKEWRKDAKRRIAKILSSGDGLEGFDEYDAKRIADLIVTKL